MVRTGLDQPARACQCLYGAERVWFNLLIGFKVEISLNDLRAAPL